MQCIKENSKEKYKNIKKTNQDIKEQATKNKGKEWLPLY